MVKTKKKIERVAFFGGADAKLNDENYDQAFETAKLLAENGYIAVNGGGHGVMTAATLGAKAGGGQVEVVLVDKENYPGNFEGENKINIENVDKKIVMENYDERVEKLRNLSDAFVIFRGGTGTIEEVGKVWAWAKFDHGNHKPVIFVGEEWKEIVKTMMKELELEEKEKEVVWFAKTPSEVLRLIQTSK